MSADEIVETLRGLHHLIARERNAEIEGVFGLYARDEQRQDCDLDLFVNLGEQATLLDLVRLGQFLEETLHGKVDVVPKRALRKAIRPCVLGDLILVGEIWPCIFVTS